MNPNSSVSTAGEAKAGKRSRSNMSEEHRHSAHSYRRREKYHNKSVDISSPQGIPNLRVRERSVSKKSDRSQHSNESLERIHTFSLKTKNEAMYNAGALLREIKR